jgi:hypothetical protein
MVPLAALLLIAPAPKPVLPPPGETTAIQGRAFELPDLPVSLQEARRDYAKVQRRLAQTLSELEVDLKETYGAGNKGTFTVFSTKLVLPKSSLEEAQYLCTFLQDREQFERENQLFQAWSEWQVALLSYRMEHEVVRQGESGLRLFPCNHADYPGPNHRLELFASGSTLAPVKTLVFAGGMPGISTMEGTDYFGFSESSRQARKQAEARLPRVLGLWKPYAQHLELRAGELLQHEYDQGPAKDPALGALRQKARIQVLERCRYATWLCELIWAHMASKPLPKLYGDFPGIS